MKIELSVVVASCELPSKFNYCLESLINVINFSEIEIIIVSTEKADNFLHLISGHKNIRWCFSAKKANLAELRGLGIEMCVGSIISILDPWCIVDRAWSLDLIKEHATRENPVIGGSVDLFERDVQGILRWATFINEYGMFLPPVNEGAVSILAGSNISYKRCVLFENDKPKYPVFWKTFVNETLKNKNGGLWLSSSAPVKLNKTVSFFDYTISRFDHGRCYAAMRCRHINCWERGLRALGAPLLPLIFVYRWSKVYWIKNTKRAKLVVTMPIQIILFSIWALGEMVGYCFGSGKSCERLKF